VKAGTCSEKKSVIIKKKKKKGEVEEEKEYKRANDKVKGKGEVYACNVKTSTG